MSYTISVDTGGTFTDVVVVGPNGLTIGKALTTRDRIILGVRAAIASAAEQIGLELPDLLAKTEMLVYGTTRATNAIVTKNVAKTAFVTTKGFPDILLLKEGGKFNPHDFSQDYPDPFIPRRHTFEVDERMSSEGTASIPFVDSSARAVIDEIKAKKFEAVAVCFLWSIANPEHELKFGAMLKEALPDVPFTLSHQLISIVREYRRASATAIDASLKPLMQQHLRGLETDLRAEGFHGKILVSTTSGGCNTIEALVEKPIYTIGSGPAMAPLAAVDLSRTELLGKDLIICDTGGTTFDVGLVREGNLTYTRETWLGPQYTGDLLGISAVDMRSIGAGGGSIAWIDSGGLMRVGPQSAGSEPGPACYGRGGTKPTVSDAAVVLGYLDPDFFLGGRMKLDTGAARRAIEPLAKAMNISVEQTAYRIVSLAGEFMIRAIGDITINEGVNPRDSAIVAGGGAAGLNIMMIAKELGCTRLLLPKVASALSAAGMQCADIVSEEAASLVTTTANFDVDGVNAVLSVMRGKLEALRSQFGGEAGNYRIEYFAEARYASQVWELDTPLPTERFTGDADVSELAEAFHRVHERVFAVRDEGSAVEIVNWKARLVISLSRSSLSRRASTDGTGRPLGNRDCYFGDDRPVRTAVYKPGDVLPGTEIKGPAIVEEETTTLVVYPGMSATVSEHGNYLLDIG
ncbi:MAG: hydantoinase/oxoprolinase family protein [Xanthobacteraceae bacterium]